MGASGQRVNEKTRSKKCKHRGAASRIAKQKAGRGLFDCFCYTLIADLYVFVCVEHWKQDIEVSRSERRRRKKK